MELLCSPKNPAWSPEKIPFVCEGQWDCGKFLSYAVRTENEYLVSDYVRKWWPESVGDPPRRSFWLSGVNRSKLEPVYQQWFFFGLLAEALGLNEPEEGERLVDLAASKLMLAQIYDDCIVEEGGQKYLNAEPIIGLKGMLFERIQAMKEHGRTAHLKRCLMMTGSMSWNDRDNIGSSVHLAIAALGEYLVMICCRVDNGLLEQPMKMGLELLRWAILIRSPYITPDSIDHKMIENGWCPSDILRIKNTYQHLTTVHLLSRLRKSTVDRDHSNCSSQVCVAAQISSISCRPAHVHDDCTCKDFTADSVRVDQILRAGSYPVLRIVAGGTDANPLADQIELDEYSPEMSYVAISHVWADGLGNSSENALPTCQVAKLCRMVRSVYRQASQEEHILSTEEEEEEEDSSQPDFSNGEPIFRFWIDTLCCPVELEGKKIALGCIADVYSNAKHTLVLDKSLTEHSLAGCDPPEIAMRVFGSSTWMRRLWTLQEGALSQKLYFHFAEKALSVIQIWMSVLFGAYQSPEWIGIYQDFSLEMRYLTAVRSVSGQDYTSYVSESDNGTPILDLLLHAVYSRNVSVPSDEPICLSTLLCLDLSYIVAVQSHEERMMRFWELVAQKYNGLPASIIFYMDRPLKHPGWRWAPSTLLGAADDHRLEMRDRSSYLGGERRDSPTGTITPLGFRVHLAGYLVTVKQLTQTIPDDVLQASEMAVRAGIMARSKKTNKWYKLTDPFFLVTREGGHNSSVKYHKERNYPLRSALRKGRCAIIADSDSIRSQRELYVLADLAEGERGEEDDSDSDASNVGQRTSGQTRVHKRCYVRAREIDEGEAACVDFIYQVVKQISEMPITITSVEIQQECEASGLHFRGDGFEDLLKRTMEELLENFPPLLEDLKDHFLVTRENAWKLLQQWFSHEYTLTECSGEHAWIVD